ncbi:MAG: histidine phosphatase family protein [Mariprofundus sp.]|nr:histidine phosphatase family protein [Mariprofundus sp.]
MAESEPIIIDLLRHGEVQAEGWAFRGSTDLPLSEQGWLQMRAVADCLFAMDHNIDHIASSPLQRCRLFANELNTDQAASLTLLDDMREMDFGDWENKTFDELEQLNGSLLKRFWHSPVGIQPPGGEAFDAFAERVIACWQNWVTTDAGGQRLLVAHGGVIRVLLAHIMDMPMHALWRLHLPYASWSRVSLCAGHQPRLLFMNRQA